MKINNRDTRYSEATSIFLPKRPSHCKSSGHFDEYSERGHYATLSCTGNGVDQKCWAELVVFSWTVRWRSARWTVRTWRWWRDGQREHLHLRNDCWRGWRAREEGVSCVVITDDGHAHWQIRRSKLNYEVRAGGRWKSVPHDVSNR